MQNLKVDLKEPKAGVLVPKPSAQQAAAYIQDMATGLRRLALDQQFATLAMLLEMVALQAADVKSSKN